MTTTHETQYWTAGDDWQVNATLLDENGDPINLTGVTIKWILLNASTSNRVLDENDVSISVTNAAAGQCSVIIPAAKTSPLAAGNYNDIIRIVSGGVTSTMSYGVIHVAIDPWLSIEALAASMKLRRVA